jgi:hypothetical protein
MDTSFFSPRKLKFKAWNTQSRLLMRLNSIDCVKGELFKKDHILLQFTGLHDNQGEEIYDMDILLWKSEKMIMYWTEEKRVWRLQRLDAKHSEDIDHSKLADMTRLCSYFESTK